jgi:hypothetical protein
MTTTTRALLLLLLLFGTAAISLAQSNNSTGALSSTGESLLIETNKDTDWQKAYDWLIFDHWGWFTMGTTFLGVVFFAALLYTRSAIRAGGDKERQRSTSSNQRTRQERAVHDQPRRIQHYCIERGWRGRRG